MLFRFIEKYGTHVIVGVKMGGKDVVYAKQLHSSSLQTTNVQKKLKDMADDLFINTSTTSNYREKVSRLPFISTLV